MNNRPNRLTVRFHSEISTSHVNIIFVLTEEQISRYASQSYILTDTSRGLASNEEIELFGRQFARYEDGSATEVFDALVRPASSAGIWSQRERFEGYAIVTLSLARVEIIISRVENTRFSSAFSITPQGHHIDSLSLGSEEQLQRCNGFTNEFPVITEPEGVIYAVTEVTEETITRQTWFTFLFINNYGMFINVHPAMTVPPPVIESVISEEEITRSPGSIFVFTNLLLRYTSNTASRVYERQQPSYEGLANVYPTMATPAHTAGVETVFTEEGITRHLESTLVLSGLLLEHNSFFERQLEVDTGATTVFSSNTTTTDNVTTAFTEEETARHLEFNIVFSFMSLGYFVNTAEIQEEQVRI